MRSRQKINKMLFCILVLDFFPDKIFINSLGCCKCFIEKLNFLNYSVCTENCEHFPKLAWVFYEFRKFHANIWFLAELFSLLVEGKDVVGKGRDWIKTIRLLNKPSICCRILFEIFAFYRELFFWWGLDFSVCYKSFWIYILRIFL